MTPYEHEIISLIKLNPKISNGEIAQHLKMKKSNAGNLIFRMESKGYIRRNFPEDSNRTLQILIT